VDTRQYSALTDEQLVDVCKSAADAAAAEGCFEELVRRYRIRIIRWCLRFTGDRESSDDLAQEILFRAFRSFNRFRGDSKLSTWIYVITRNQCRTAVRKRACEPLGVDQQAAAAIPDARAAAVYASIDQRQAIEGRLRLVSQALTATEAKIMMLHYGEEIPLAAITSSLGLRNRSGAKAYIVSARRKLSSARPLSSAPKRRR
jgi:RNA polymerase sigma-70 factor (ECF subfamily)